ncbi:EAL domain-containing protein [Millisia brevis]|uniref:EAL domain-containing protein n=1 Tax=Millisia brevis TaxID=264148 RepID=UPI00083271B8|nr:EAL domain-containing protein [Millisia brevis]
MATEPTTESADSAARPRLPLPYRILRIITVAVGVLYAAATLISEIFPDGFLDTFYNVAIIITSLFACIRPILIARDRLAWALIAAAITLWSIGDIYWTSSFIDAVDIPVPSLADGFYLAMYPLAYIGLILLVRSATGRVPASVWLDGAVTALAAGAIFSALTMNTVLAASIDDSQAATLTNLSYPIGDLALMVIVVAVLTMVRWRPDPMWWSLGLGAAFFAVADTGYLFTVAHETYAVGSWIDAVWMLGLTLMAVAGTLERPDRADDVRGLAVLLVPIVFSFAALTVLIVGTFIELHPSAIVLAAACLVTVAVRTVLTFQQSKALARSEIDARTDRVSGLGNRRVLDAALDRMLADASPNQQVGATILAIDDLAELNGTLGYTAGDHLLHAFGSRLAAAIEPPAACARLGGAEFAVIHAGGADIAEFRERAKQLLEVMARPFLIDNTPIQVQLRAGIALSPGHADTSEELVQYAAEALHAAKRAHSSVEVYDARSAHTRLYGPAIVAELNAADEDELLKIYQPRFDLTSDRVSDVAVSLRWNHPIHGMLPAETLSNIATHAGLASRLTETVLRSALEQCSRWHASGSGTGVTIEATLADVFDSRLPYDVARMVNAFDVPSAAATIRIPEEVLLVDPQRAAHVLGQFRDFGVRVSIDHFGRSAPSITRLRALPIDELSFSPAFLETALTGAQDASLVRSVVDFARGLGLATVATGVDTPALRDIVATCGFSHAQGNMLAPETGPAGLGRWLFGTRPLAVAGN